MRSPSAEGWRWRSEFIIPNLSERARTFSVLHLFSSFIDMCSLKWPQGGEDEDEMGDVAAETPTVAVKAKEEEVDAQQ